MTRRLLFPSILIAGAMTGAVAASLEDDLSSRWSGAWVILQVEAYSGCDGFHTNNRVRGDLVTSKGRHRFGSGELAKVTGVDLKRDRVDLLLALEAPILVPYHEGPFTLYSRRECRVEIMLELPREVVAAGDPAPLHDAIRRAMEAHPSIEEARRSESWNGRASEPFPEDYERTLAMLGAWKATQHNASVEALLDGALEEADRFLDRLRDDPDYLAGFAAGVEVARDRSWDGCEKALSGSFTLIESKALKARRRDTPENRAWRRGHEDGQRLVRSLEMLRRLPGCYVPVPPVPDPVPTSSSLFDPDTPDL